MPDLAGVGAFFLNPSFDSLLAVLAAALVGWAAAALYWSAPPAVRAVERLPAPGPLSVLAGAGGDRSAALLALAHHEVLAWRERVPADGRADAAPRAVALLRRIDRLSRRARRAASPWWPLGRRTPSDTRQARRHGREVDTTLADVDRLTRPAGGRR
jgi:hypothetical protein